MFSEVKFTNILKIRQLEHFPRITLKSKAVCDWSINFLDAFDVRLNVRVKPNRKRHCGCLNDSFWATILCKFFYKIWIYKINFPACQSAWASKMPEMGGKSSSSSATSAEEKRESADNLRKWLFPSTSAIRSQRTTDATPTKTHSFMFSP